MKDCAEASACSGPELSQIRKIRTLKLCQTDYSKMVLERLGMADCRPISTPMEQQIDTTNLADSPIS